LPKLSGLDFQAELVKANNSIPIVLMTGHGNVQMSVKAMELGGVDFLPKPFRDQELLDAVTVAFNGTITPRGRATGKGCKSSRGQPDFT